MSDKTQVPQDLKYTKEHEWVRIEGDEAVVGITDYAQHALGDITYVDLPPAAKRVSRGDELGAVESAKAASDVYAPVGGKVIEVNPLLEDASEKVNQSPYEEGWICKLGSVNSADVESLLTPAQYEEQIAQEET